MGTCVHEGAALCYACRLGNTQASVGYCLNEVAGGVGHDLRFMCFMFTQIYEWLASAPEYFYWRRT